MDNLTTSLQLVHPAEAEHWLVAWQYDKQRAVRPYHVQFLMHLLTHDRFRPGTPIDVGVLKGRRYLLNGQHTLNAVAKTGRPTPLVLIEHKVRDQDHLAQLYATFDRQLTRKPADMMRAYAFGDTYGLNSATSNALYSAVRLILSGFVWERPHSSVERAYLRDEVLLYTAMCDWAEEAQVFQEECTGAPDKILGRLQRQGCYAVALTTLRHKVGGAQDFWHAVAHDTETEGHPAKALLHFLLDTHARHYPAQVYARYVAAAWNRYMEERQVKNLRAQDIAHPMYLAGTPHDGQAVWRYLSETWEILHMPVRYDDAFYRRHGAALRQAEGVLV